MVVEGNHSDHRLVIGGLVQLRADFLAIGTYVFDRVDNQNCRRVCEGAIGFRRIAVFLRVVLLDEELSTGELVYRRALAKGQCPLGQRA